MTADAPLKIRSLKIRSYRLAIIDQRQIKKSGSYSN